MINKFAQFVVLAVTCCVLFTCQSLKAMPGGGCTAITGDDCTVALAMAGASGCSTTTTSTAGCPLTFVSPTPCSASQGSGAMYFVRVTASNTCNNITFNIDSWTGGGTVNAFIFTSDCTSGTYTYQADGCITAPGSITAQGVPAGTYYLAFGGTTGVVGTASWCYTISNAGAPPSNDACSSPQPLSANTIYTSDVYCATSTCNYSNCTNTGQDCRRFISGVFCNTYNMASCWGSVENSVWYSFTAPASPAGTNTWYVQLYNQMCNNANGVQFSVFSAVDCNNAQNTQGNQLACTNNANTSNINAAVNFTAGQTYYIVVDGFAGAQCQYNLFISTVLPVEWGHASADLIGNQVALNWSTRAESGNKEFIIEAANISAEEGLPNEDKPMKWTELGRIPGSGATVTSMASYRFVDYRPMAGYNFYRLTQIDYDGQRSSYANLLQVFVDENALTGPQFTLMPNPFHDQVTFDFRSLGDEEQANFLLYDAAGRQVFARSFKGSDRSRNGVRLDLSALPTGTYFYQVRSKSGSTGGKLVKE